MLVKSKFGNKNTAIKLTERLKNLSGYASSHFKQVFHIPSIMF